MKPLTELFNCHERGRGLYVGSGPSGQSAAQKAWNIAWLERQYDFVIVPNRGYEPFAPIARITKRIAWYSLQMESGAIRFPWFWDIPVQFIRLHNPAQLERMTNQLTRWRAWRMHHVPKHASAAYFQTGYEADRKHYPIAFNPRPAGYTGGLIKGPVDDINHSRGTATLQAMHLACLMGASALDLIGCELCWKDDRPHYFEDANPFGAVKSEWMTSVMLGGEEYQTHRHFANSAAYLDKLYPVFVAAGMNISRCCDSLISAIPRRELP